MFTNVSPWLQTSRDVILSRISSVLVDDVSDSVVVRVDSTGFHPSSITVHLGCTVLWTWKDSGDETHNIIHVTSPDDDVRRNRFPVSTAG